MIILGCLKKILNRFPSFFVIFIILIWLRCFLSLSKYAFFFLLEKFLRQSFSSRLLIVLSSFAETLRSFSVMKSSLKSLWLLSLKSGYTGPYSYLFRLLNCRFILLFYYLFRWFFREGGIDLIWDWIKGMRQWNKFKDDRGCDFYW